MTSKDHLFSYVIDLIGHNLTIKDTLILSRVSKSTQAAITCIEEEVFSKHMYVDMISKALTLENKVFCTHINADGIRIFQYIPLPYGLSSKNVLRALMEYMHIHRNNPISVHVHLQQQHFKIISLGEFGSFILKESMLFTTRKYSQAVSVTASSENCELCFNEKAHFLDFFSRGWPGKNQKPISSLHVARAERPPRPHVGRIDGYSITAI